MIEYNKTKLKSPIERTWDGRKGKVIAFDSFDTVAIEWDNGEIEYMVNHKQIDNVDAKFN